MVGFRSVLCALAWAIGAISSSAQVDVLYLYGSDPPAIHQMRLGDTGNEGMSQFRAAVDELSGVSITEAAAFLDDPSADSPELTEAFLADYEVLILGSNNKRFTQAEADAVAAWVEAGGGLIAWSDSAFGGPFQNGGINNTVGADSNNDLTEQFGMRFLRDNGAGVFEIRAYLDDHYLNDYDRSGGVVFRGEGVSCIRLSEPAIALARLQQGTASGNVRLNPNDNPFDPARDVALAYATVGDGRVVGTFDRNTFWNAGAGTRLSQFDNREFAQRLVLWAAGLDESPTALHATANPVMTGEAEVWHTQTLTFAGPSADENDWPSPNRDYRLLVTFEHASGEASYTVPGYFAGDGHAGETGATSGDKWRVHFSPDRDGVWNWSASFRTGNDVALAFNADWTPVAGAGMAVAPIDGMSGQFTVSPSDAALPDFRARGRLEYVGERYLRFRGDGTYFLKFGADSPENFLGYYEFDATEDNGGQSNDLTGAPHFDGLHHYDFHLNDWTSSDPTWRQGQGKRIVGAINYLASEGINSIYFLTLNIHPGDGREVYPWNRATTSTDAVSTARYDNSKLDQWQRVLGHMSSQGILLHVLTQETENDQFLNGGALGKERQLYYLQLIARFAHFPALKWNLGEENTNSTPQQKAFAAFLKANDPYRHPIVIHTFPGDQDKVYGPLLGDPNIDGPSLQGGAGGARNAALKWIAESAAAGHRWFACQDEYGGASVGVSPDTGYPGFGGSDNHDQMRKDVLWGNPMAGGSGSEAYFGYNNVHSDLDCEDFRSRDDWWDYNRYAAEFFFNHVPFWRMRVNDALSSTNGWVLEEDPTHPDVVIPSAFVVYFKSANNTGTLTVPSSAELVYTIRWFNPRTGQFEGSPQQQVGGGAIALGPPPSGANEDWAVLIEGAGDGEFETATVNVIGGRVVGVGTSGEFPVGFGIQIAADPPPPGQVFALWSANPPATFQNPASATTLVTVPSGGTTVSASYMDAPPGPAVTGFGIVDADADVTIAQLEAGENRVPESIGLSLSANVSGSPVGSVTFELRLGATLVKTQTESVPPYALNGDTGGNFTPFAFALGSTYTVTATPYAQSGGNGTAGTPLTMTFTLRDDLPCPGDHDLDGDHDGEDVNGFLGDLENDLASADRDDPRGVYDWFDLRGLLVGLLEPCLF